MLETLTARDLLATFSTKKIQDLFIDALVEQNVVAFNVAANELKSREMQTSFPDLIFKAFENGAIIGYSTPIANSLRKALSDIKKCHPLNKAIWSLLAKNATKDEILQKGDFFELIGKRQDSIYDDFCYHMPTDEVVKMSPELLEILIDHYSETVECQPLDDKIMDKEHEEKTRRREAAIFMISQLMDRQIYIACMNEFYYSELDYRVDDILKISKKRAMLKSSAKSDTNPDEAE